VAAIDPEDTPRSLASAIHVLALGFGIHQCLGQPLARLELQVAYPALLHRFPGLRVAAPLEDIRFRDDMLVYGVHALPAKW
jgi:cytochrome P450